MKIKNRFILSFVAPFMILVSAIGLIFKDNTKKIFYLPIGLMGISIILEKDVELHLVGKRSLLKMKIKRWNYLQTSGELLEQHKR